MSTPTPDRIRAATAALRAEADRWDQQARALDDAAAQAGPLGMTRLEAGVFQVFCAAYQQAYAQIVDRCTEGRQAMQDVAATLRDTADTYDREEATNEHRFRDLY